VSASTGPVLAGGALVVFRDVVINRKDWTHEFKPIAAAGVLALGLMAVEQGLPVAARAMAWLYVSSVVLVPPPGGKSPVQAFFDWYGKG
jgi:hypothetical protein